MADDTLGATQLTWRNVALIAGEHLAPTGPTGYYDFTPEQWLTWVREQIAAVRAEQAGELDRLYAKLEALDAEE